MNDDPHPAPEEIQPYVAIGPTDEYSVSVNKSTFDTGFIIFTIIGVIVLLAIIVATVIFALRAATLPPPPPPLPKNPQPLTLQQNFGAASSSTYPIGRNLLVPEEASALAVCDAEHHAEIIDGQCRCIPPFFGANCQLERHSNRFFSVGVPNEMNVNFKVLAERKSNGKSFNSEGTANSCSEQCDQTAECVGFIYHAPNMCTLLQEDIVIPGSESIPYSPEIESTLYLRTSENLKFVDRIFLAESFRSFPPRYWLVGQSAGYTQLPLNTVTKLDFYPRNIMSHGSYLGIYSLQPFTSEMIPHLLRLGPHAQCYIHYPGIILDIPADWEYKGPIYVAYIRG